MLISTGKRQTLRGIGRLLLVPLVLCLPLVASWFESRPAVAANAVSVVAWTCPPGTAPTTDGAALPTTCTAPAEGVQYSLTAGNVTRRRVTGSGQPASWPAVAGPFQLSIETPPGEPAIVICDQNGAITRYDAPAGFVSGELATGANLTCQWYRLAAAVPPTQAPPIATEAPPATVAGATGDFASRVDIGGRSLFLSCTGVGAPTVLLEAGGPGGFSDRWSPIVPQLAGITRVCTYDRAGLGQSDAAPAGIRTIQDSVNDLRALLNTIPLGCPCVFAGESWGGSILRLFAGLYASDVAGLVFIDAVPPGFTEQFGTLVPAKDSGFAALMGTDNVERMDQLNSLRKADEAAPPPPVPIVVMTHGLFLGFPLTFPVDQLEQLWRTGQEAYARAIHARLIVATTSGNSVVRDQPELVVDAVRVVVAAARDPAAFQTSLHVHRLDAAGQPLPGACFQIWKDAGAGARGEYQDGACDADVDGVADGTVQFRPFPAGNYVLQEVKPPDGVPAAPDVPVVMTGLVTHVDVKSAAPATAPATTPTVTPTVTPTP
ncbi:MAG: hypothetical protein QOF73_5325 [Thermomicrobiales bacterium]|nr:hypothetical protein [Thermomicrobiales bacterium]